MYVYIWKRPNGEPFYVGLSKSMGRTDPKKAGGRGWLCKQTMQEIGLDKIIVELHPVATVEEGQALEQQFIASIGRIQMGTGPLTNLRPGGEGTKTMSEKGKESLSAFMKAHNPMHNPEIRKKATETMRTNHVKAKYSGDKNPAKRPEVRAKLKAKWQEPEFREKMCKRPSRPSPSEEEREAARQRLLNPDNPMREAHVFLNSNPEIREKRNAANRSPESRAKKSESMKRVWAERKAAKG